MWASIKSVDPRHVKKKACPISGRVIKTHLKMRGRQQWLEIG